MHSETDRPADEFALLFEAHPLPLLVFDRGTLALVEANVAAVEQYGWERAELLRMNLADLHPEADHEAMYRSTSQPVGSARARGVWRHCTRSGAVRDIQVTVSDIVFAGRPSRLALCRDVTAELRAQAAQRFLADASSALASTLDLDVTLREVAALAVPALADFCTVFLLDAEGGLRQVAGVHRDPAKSALLDPRSSVYAPSLDDPLSLLARVVRTGVAELREPANPEPAANALVTHEIRQVVRDLSPVSYIVAPLVGPQGAIGGFALAQSESGRRFGPSDLELATELGRRAGMAVENARLYDAARSELEQRRRAEERMRDAEERYRALFERSPECVFVHALDGSFIDVNEAGLQLLGFTREELGRMNVEELFAPREREHVRRVFQEIESLDEGLGFTEYAFLPKRGGEVLLEAKASALRRGGVPYAILGIVRDLSERRRAEQALSRLAAIVESSHEAIFSTDVEGVVTSWNSGAERIFGYTAAQSIGRDYMFVVPEGRQDAAREMFTRACAGERLARLVSATRKDGSTGHVLLTLSPTLDAAGRLTGIGFIGHDESERVELEQKLGQAQKMEAIGRLAGGVAHDFNNILTSVKGHSAFLLDALAQGDPRREDVSEIDRAADRAQSLTRQLLAFGRRQVLQPRELDLNAVVVEMGSMLRRLLGEDIELRAHLDRHIGLVRADPGQLQQVVLNLAVNARDAMPQGGRLTIATESRRLPADGSAGLAGGLYVALVVHDEGLGIAPEVMPHIFEPFFTTKDAATGTGLGLATVYGIVTQSGGDVQVQSEPERGTTFTVLLPEVAPAPGFAAPPAAVEVRSTGLATGTILLVEDEHAVRQVALRTLRAAGYRVLAAGDGEEALRLEREHEGPIHLLVSDVVLPGIGGRVVAERVAAARPGTPILFISGYAEDAVLRRDASEPGVNFLEKPFAPGELRRKVQEVLTAKG